MSEKTSGNQQVTSVKCEIHGLRYNPNLHSGCVRCRKEAGEKIGPPARQPAAGDPAADDDSVIPALGVALALVAAAGAGLFVVHQNVYDKAQSVFSGTGLYDEEFGEAYDEYDEYDETGDDYTEEKLSPEEQRELEELQEERGKAVSDG